MRIRIVPGDITTFQGDAVVNAANNAGLGGGGVDGAIHRAAGPRLLDACADMPVVHGLQGLAPGMRTTDEVRIPTGEVRVTPGFNLPAPWVIHTAGPVWPEEGAPYGSEAFNHLWNCHRNPALVALGMGLKHIAYPAISTGVYGCPQERCAEIALKWAKDCAAWPLDVTFYIFPELPNLAIWQATAERLGVRLGA